MQLFLSMLTKNYSCHCASRPSGEMREAWQGPFRSCAGPVRGDSQAQHRELSAGDGQSRWKHLTNTRRRRRRKEQEEEEEGAEKEKSLSLRSTELIVLCRLLSFFLSFFFSPSSFISSFILHLLWPWDILLFAIVLYLPAQKKFKLSFRWTLELFLSLFFFASIPEAEFLVYSIQFIFMPL